MFGTYVMYLDIERDDDHDYDDRESSNEDYYNVIDRYHPFWALWN